MKQYLIILVSILLIPFYQTIAQVHTSYLWHMQQPNYWPETSLWHPYHYQTVRESYELKTSGNAHNIYSDGKSHPLNDLQEIFSKADRVAAYQYRLKDAVQTMLRLDRSRGTGELFGLPDRKHQQPGRKRPMGL